MDFKLYFLLIVISISYSDGFGQVSLAIEEFEEANSSIKLNIKLTNESEKDIQIKRVKNRYDAIDYFTPVESDSINYEGISFLLFEGKDTLKVNTFPVDLQHRSKLANWLDLFWLKIKRTFINDNLSINGNTSVIKKVKIKLDGFLMSKEVMYGLQMVYYLPNTEKVITSNKINFRYKNER